MSTIRQDPTTKEWVIVATNRAHRPRDSGTCPFCAGNESRTDPELLRIPDGGEWQVRVIPNGFAALSPADRVGRWEPGPLFREMAGVGHHEVIIDTPVHDRTMAFMSDEEVTVLLRAFRARHQALRADPNVRYILIFKNQGENAGTSLTHPHSQIVATPVAPLHVRQKYRVATGYYDDTGRCLYCDVLEAERAAGVRLVFDSPGFTVFEPFASQVPFETWIMPQHHQASFGQVSDGDITRLAPVVRRTLRALHEALDDPHFNLIIHSAPVEDEDKPYYLWHVQILPRVATIAGFELGSGMRVTSASPEESASVLRELVR
jgi:UDPglucose--hexose-1-phosphate uridylyltransferase